ncbi:MAG: DUF2851 family protein [Nitrospinae bacterium]|nr:DUF2851 family protein [Nitrospinota bacterium]
MFSRAYLEATEPILPLARDLIEKYGAQPLRRERENVVLALWLERPWGDNPIRDVKGRPLTISFPGWLSGGPGPDFKGARFSYDGGPAQTGDVEAHVRASDWTRHGHHLDPAYDNTRLHVTLYCDASHAPFTTSKGAPLIELELGVALAAQVHRLRGADPLPPPLTALKDRRQGRCGAAAGAIGLERALGILDAAADARARLKAQRRAEESQGVEPGEAWYRAIAQSLGLVAFKNQFAALARAAPLSKLRAAALLADQPRRALFMEAALFGVAGLMPSTVPDGGPEDEKHISALLQSWERVQGETGLAPAMGREDWRMAGTRPANFPMGRIAALAAFLARFADTDMAILFTRLVDTFPARDDRRARSAWLDGVAAMFEPAAEHYWARRYIFGGRRLARPRALAGPERAGLILVNAVIPLFLGEGQSQPEFEQKLRALYHALPPRGPSGAEEFFSKNYFNNLKLPRTEVRAARQEGMIQIYNDFCLPRAAACAQCPFAAYLEGLADSPDADNCPF